MRGPTFLKAGVVSIGAVIACAIDAATGCATGAATGAATGVVIDAVIVAAIDAATCVCIGYASGGHCPAMCVARIRHGKGKKQFLSTPVEVGYLTSRQSLRLSPTLDLGNGTRK